MAFNRAHGFVINSLNQWDIRVEGERDPEKRLNAGFEHLQASIVPGAFHNSGERFDPPKCHPDTRKAVLNNIMSWAEDHNHKSGVMWLYGPAGAGKSAIAQTCAELCEAKGTLAATFFFSRTATGRNTEAQLISTIVYQLALSIPALRSLVNKAIQKDFLIFSRSLKVQIKVLIIEPLLSLLALDDVEPNQSPQLVIIDGLDECNNPRVQRGILEAISMVFIKEMLPIRFLVTSRPEQEIREAFNVDEISRHTLRLALDDSFNPDADIEVFIRSKFVEIQQQHFSRPFPEEWPSDTTIASLVQRSSGQFIYASVAMNYIADPRHLPTKRLDIILGIVPRGKDTPFAQLDALYTLILCTVEIFERTSCILGALLFLSDDPRIILDPYNLKSPKFIDELLGFEGETCPLLSDLHSILGVPHHTDTKAIRMYHASFGDYLQERSRSCNFYLDEGEVHANLARCCLRAWKQMQPTANGVYEYASSHIFYHCSRSSPKMDLLEDLSMNPAKFFKVIVSASTRIRSRIKHAQFTYIIETEAVSTLSRLDRLASEDPNILQISLKLRTALEKRHLDLLANYAIDSYMPLYLAVATSLSDGFHTPRLDFGAMCGMDKDMSRRYLEADSDYGLGLSVGCSEDYLEWLSYFLRDPSRSKTYCIGDETYSYSALQVIKYVFEDPNVMLNDRDPRHAIPRIEKLLINALPSKGLESYLISHMDIPRKISFTGGNTMDLIELHKEIRHYLQRCGQTNGRWEWKARDKLNWQRQEVLSEVEGRSDENEAIADPQYIMVTRASNSRTRTFLKWLRRFFRLGRHAVGKKS